MRRTSLGCSESGPTSPPSWRSAPSGPGRHPAWRPRFGRWSAALSGAVLLAATAAGCGSGGGGDGFPGGGAASKGGGGAPGSSSATGGSGSSNGATGATGATGSATGFTGGAPKGSVPVSGGTLLVTADHTTAVAADPDRDLISIVDLASHTVTAQLTLPAGAEPGRLVQDGSGRVHAILRRGGGIADIDLASHALVGVRQVCALPRGIAYRATDGSLLVSCLSGALVTMDADPTQTAPRASVTVQTGGGALNDLRDVIVSGSAVYVTTFRSAQLLQVGEGGVLLGQPTTLNTRADSINPTIAALMGLGFTTQNFIPEVAWRAVLDPAGNIVMVHQAGTDRVINVEQVDDAGSDQGTGSAYGGSSGGPFCVPPIVIDAVSRVSPTGQVSDGPVLPNGALPVDIAVTSDGKNYIVALAGNPGGPGVTNDGETVNVLSIPVDSPGDGNANLCGQSPSADSLSVPGQVTAVALDGSDQVIAQTREPATLQYLTASGVDVIPLSPVSVADVGFALFHTNTGTGMACAGCHPEGQDDGRVWKFTSGLDASGNPLAVEVRRTQTFRAGFLETAPFHWSGQFSDMPGLIENVLVTRMGAAVAPTPSQETALEQWLNGIPPKMHDAPSTELAQSIASGKALFEDQTVGCTGCHSGANFTNNQDADIGFGVYLQVPTLIDVAFRAPYLHDGSVPTLLARFSDPTAMSGKHGNTSQLSPSQIGDLVAYLESL